MVELQLFLGPKHEHLLAWTGRVNGNIAHVQNVKTGFQTAWLKLLVKLQELYRYSMGQETETMAVIFKVGVIGSHTDCT